MAEKKADQFYTRPPKLGKWEGFRIFLWNSETHQFLGRTGASWGKIILFYLLFYAALVGFFAAMLTIFYQTLDAKRPKWLLNKSLIGSNPGLGFRPMPPESNVESTLIWYKSSDEENIKYWKTQLDDFLQSYKKDNNPYVSNIENCTQGNHPTPGKVCDVNVLGRNWMPCHYNSGYKYNSSSSGPCIFLKLNRIFGWVPEYYNSSNIPSIMPQELKDHIKNYGNPDSNMYNLKELQTVWVSCEGENPADVENIGPIKYIPKRGFAGQYFPFENIGGYLSPIVAVHFENPTRSILINIECKAWASNIYHDRQERRGSVHFELLVDY